MYRAWARRKKAEEEIPQRAELLSATGMEQLAPAPEGSRPIPAHGSPTTHHMVPRWEEFINKGAHGHKTIGLTEN